MESAGRVEWMRRLEADNHKFSSDFPGSLTFVEELLSLMTLQTYLCNNFIISETIK